ncbi:protein kinase domain containing protein [Acanthamoeba castellanii str. Neff]|uniref:Protein kinase domain containing protein n=1 Tax=Acanthamoeba castellanii (strain ATCC 30010 / Neff) TaxID=1257118 RepID=L8GHZ3_ACACF|nr:protein kinase domain containing protein [Acanthamoeba castellanii str. Neff]ELR11811.1 protein kinase domain containing protein [Acanthamoeba castellanii str. Neff]
MISAEDHQRPGGSPSPGAASPSGGEHDVHSRLFQLVLTGGLEGRHFGDYCIVSRQCLLAVGRLEGARQIDEDANDGEDALAGGAAVESITREPAWGQVPPWQVGGEGGDGDDDADDDDGGDGHSRGTTYGARDKRLAYLGSVRLCPCFIAYEDLSIDVRVIGSGSYGQVHKGRWKGSKVAVKRLIYINRRSEEAIQRLLSETAVLSTVEHRNVVRFVGACIQEPRLCIVTEYISGGSLRSHLDGGRQGSRGGGGSSGSVAFDMRARISMLLGAAKGLRHLHRKGIHHCDVKAANLLVEPVENSLPTIKVCDFGMAHTKNQARTTTRGGTPAWTAPEIIRGGKRTDRSDVYSFGILMWEVLTRRRPFAGLPTMSISLQVLEGERPSIPLDTPNDYRSLMVRCWAEDPADRPSMIEIASQLKRMAATRNAAHDNVGSDDLARHRLPELSDDVSDDDEDDIEGQYDQSDSNSDIDGGSQPCHSKRKGKGKRALDTLVI